MDINDIQSITVLGAGSMGHGIAELAAIAGYSVMLRDISEDLVQEGYDQIEWSLGKLVDQEQLAESEVDDALNRITPIVDIEEAVQDTDFVIEAVPERIDIKREVYEAIDPIAPDHGVFASNTSSISITELSETTTRPKQVCGMHFFNPPVRMELVEVIAGDHTSQETLEVTETLAEEFGKTSVRVRKDSPGFIVNRVAVPLMNEVAWLVHEGEATIEEIDSTTKYDMGLPMGTFELADYVGLDVSYDVLVYVHEELGDAYEPCPLLEEKVESEELGTKTGKGFYDYENGGAEIPVDAGREDVEGRLLAVMANEVAKLIQEDVADAEEIDMAVKLGLAFPDGPARMADDYGLEDLVSVLHNAYDDTSHPRYEPAELLDSYVDDGRGFYAVSTADRDMEYEVLQLERNDGVGRIVIDRPHRMNTITVDLIDELDRAIDEFEDHDEVRAILLTGAGDRAFSAGADVQAFASGADPLTAVELSRRGQQVFGRLESTDLPVVAGIDGYCLGGGMELATGADLRVASERSTFGQPEHNLGLLPGWGGTQRLRNIVGEGRAKEIIFTGDHYDAETMAEYGFVNEVVGNDEFDERSFELAQRLAEGPPVAQRYTKRAMLAGRANGDAGLEIEAEAFGILVTTDDVIEGITAFMNDEDPDFKGT